MTRIVHFGAELGHIHADNLTVNGAGSTYDTSVVRSGARSYKFDASATQSLFYNFTGAVSRRVWATVWFRLPAATGLPSIASRLLVFQTGAGTTLCGATLRADGKIRLTDQANALIGSDSVATIAVDTWYRLDLAVEIETGSLDYAEVRLDGATVASTTTGAFSDTAPGRLHFGWFDDPGTSEVVYIDDVVINDEQGSVNNTWPANERVYALRPTADSARDAGWLDGGGGTTSLFEAVNNVPPTGTTTAVNGSQIKNAVSTTTEEYDATMTTYTAAGVGATDTVTAVYGVWEAGSSSTTGSDTIAGEVESNPAIAEATSTVDSVVGVYPTGWNRGQTVIAENPTVTLGTAPVMSMRKAVATTRIHQVALMAMVVSAAPASSIRGASLIETVTAVTAAAQMRARGSSTLTLATTATVIGQLRARGSATVAIASTLTAVGGLQAADTFQGSSIIAATSTVSATGQVRARGVSTIAAAGTVTAIGQMRVRGVSTAAAASTTTATGQLRARGVVTIAASAALTATGGVQGGPIHGSSTIAAVTTLTATGQARMRGTATIAALSTVTASGGLAPEPPIQGSASIGILSGVAVMARLLARGSVSIEAQMMLSAQGGVVTGVTVPLVVVRLRATPSGLAFRGAAAVRLRKLPEKVGG